MDTTPQFLLIPVIELELLEDNPREISEKEMKSLCNDIRKDPNFLMQRPPLVNYSDGRMVVYAGNQRVRAAIRNGLSEIHCWVEKNVPLAVQQERMLKDNLHRGAWDMEALREFDTSFLLDVGFKDEELKDLLPDFSTDESDTVGRSLSERFLIPPFSVFDSRQGYWQDRKRHWSKLFDSQETREGVELIAKSGQSSAVYELRNKMRQSQGKDPSWDEIIIEAKKRGLHMYEGK